MSKIDLRSEDVTLTPKELTGAEKVEQTLVAWYHELEQMQYNTTAQYEAEGIKALYDDKTRLQAMMSRVDTLMAKGSRLHRKVQNSLQAAKDLYEDEVDQLRTHPERFKNTAYAFQEREACYRSAPGLIGARIKIREWERLASDCETFVKVCTHKYRHFDGFRQDQLTQLSLIRLGFGMREIDFRESNR